MRSVLGDAVDPTAFLLGGIVRCGDTAKASDGVEQFGLAILLEECGRTPKGRECEFGGLRTGDIGELRGDAEPICATEGELGRHLQCVSGAELDEWGIVGGPGCDDLQAERTERLVVLGDDVTAVDQLIEAFGEQCGVVDTAELLDHLCSLGWGDVVGPIANRVQQVDAVGQGHGRSSSSSAWSVALVVRVEVHGNHQRCTTTGIRHRRRYGGAGRRGDR
ncbi:hypothetical protein [Rhodococcus wratislaviensis]|uniref:hypothetical protein n=1 Tax=Rhodococcus wratislaviensis TaxID=44752 RepID=UPI0012DC87F3|nr:hypothetical protein [Rhodococcus wratislaviensis]